jgi:hypothetical protein
MRRIKLNGSNFTLENRASIYFDKPTTILVIDPCYIYDYTKKELDKFWGEFCDLMFSDKGKEAKIDRVGTLEHKEAKMLYSGTAYGDGSYPVKSNCEQEGEYAGVDAGMLCVISLEDAKKINPDTDHYLDLAVVIHDFEGNINADGDGDFEGDKCFSVVTGDLEDDDDSEEE